MEGRVFLTLDFLAYKRCPKAAPPKFNRSGLPIIIFQGVPPENWHGKDCPRSPTNCQSLTGKRDCDGACGHYYLEDHPRTWWYEVNNNGDCKSPQDRVVWPLPNGLFMACKWGLLTTYKFWMILQEPKSHRVWEMLVPLWALKSNNWSGWFCAICFFILFLLTTCLLLNIFTFGCVHLCNYCVYISSVTWPWLYNVHIIYTVLIGTWLLRPFFLNSE